MKKKCYFNKENEHLINWKSVGLLKTYTTRFWEMKPRRFTWNTVKYQKRVKKAISRARYLWLIPYIK